MVENLESKGRATSHFSGRNVGEVRGKNTAVGVRVAWRAVLPTV